MARSYRYLHFDVFTGRPFTGNQLAVFLDGRGLRDQDMQAIATEMNFSESTFVFPPVQVGTDMRVRIFTPAEELPMAGHPTIGTTFALARTGVLAPGQARVVLGLGVGPTPVDLTWRGDDLAFAWMTQLNPSVETVQPDRAAVAAGLRVEAAAIAGTGRPLEIISCGVAYLIVPFATRTDVDRASFDVGAYDAAFRAIGRASVPPYLFTTDSGPDGATTYTRMFGAGVGIAEDPATGSAAGPLGCYLVRHGIVTGEKAATIVNLQGVRMGRPSVIHIAIASDGGAISGVKVGGEAVLVGEGTVYA